MTTARNSEPFPFEGLLPELQQCIGAMLGKTDFFHLALANRAQLHLQQHEIFKRFMTSHSINQIMGTSESTFFKTMEGFVFACGHNSHGHLGVGDKQPRKTPVRIPGLFNIKKMDLLNGSHVLFLSHDGKLWQMRGGLLLLVERLPALLDMATYVYPDRPTSTILLLAEDGRVFVSGENRFGCLGIPGRRWVADFQAVPGLEKIKRMLFSNHLAMYIDHNGKVLVVGENSRGQLALRDQRHRGVPTLVPALSAQSPAIKQGWSDGYSTFLQTIAGDVYACGRNEAGELGMGVVSEHCIDPILIPQLKNVTNIHFHRGSVYALTPEGQVLAWGKNDKGQLGLGDEKNRYLPTLIPGLPPIAKMQCKEKVLFFSREGLLFACGQEINELPGMEQGPVNSAKPLPVPGVEKLQDAYNGERIFTLLRRDGVVFVGGDNTSYALGVDVEGASVPLQVAELLRVRQFASTVRPEILLHYANQGAEHFHDVCFSLAVRKLRFLMKPEDIRPVLPLLYTKRCSDSNEIKALFPGYQMLPMDATSALIDAYVCLLAIYKSLIGALKSDIVQRHSFIAMLQEVITPVEVERKTRSRRDRDEERTPGSRGLARFGAFAQDLQGIPADNLKRAAEILLPHLPKPELPELKRPREDGPGAESEGGEPEKKRFKKE